MIPLLLVRHGKTSWNLEKKLQGKRDITLSVEGRQELKNRSIPPEFSGFEWVSSPLSRARETADILGAIDLKIEDSLIEMDWGNWEGFTIQELRQKYGSAMAANEAKGLNMLPPGGESPAMVQARIKKWLQSLRKPTIAVTHKGVIRAIKSLAYGWDMTDKSPVPFDWNCVHLFQVDETGFPAADRVNIKLESK